MLASMGCFMQVLSLLTTDTFKFMIITTVSKDFLYEDKMTRHKTDAE